jgi:serine phosphatase RsbU (regulator of sigma subunit)
MPGDVFVLYTDGLIEARSETEGFYGRRRIERALAHYAPELPPHELVLQIYGDVKKFGAINDDTVVFAVRCGS